MMRIGERGLRNACSAAGKDSFWAESCGLEQNLWLERHRDTKRLRASVEMVTLIRRDTILILKGYIQTQVCLANTEK